MRTLSLRSLRRMPYEACWQAMREFTDKRNASTSDEMWLVEHPPVYTQGQAGKAEHLLDKPDDIPLVQSDRGGQVTYHGPGQLVVYPLLDLRRLKLGVRDLVTGLENTVVDLLGYYGLEAAAKADAPGVYIAGRKIASLGLRVRKGCSFHGVALNVNMDLRPFLSINPCGYPGLEMIQLKDFIQEKNLPSLNTLGLKFAQIFCLHLNMGLHTDQAVEQGESG